MNWNQRLWMHIMLMSFLGAGCASTQLGQHPEAPNGRKTPYKTSQEVYTVIDIEEMVRSQGAVEYVDGKAVLDDSKLTEYGIPKEYAEEVANIRDANGNFIFNLYHGLRLANEFNIPPEQIRRLGQVADESGNALLDYSDIWMLFHNGKDTDYFERMSNLTFKDGRKIFEAEQIPYIADDLTPEYVESLADLLGPDGEPFFGGKGYPFSWFKQRDGTRDDAEHILRDLVPKLGGYTNSTGNQMFWTPAVYLEWMRLGKAAEDFDDYYNLKAKDGRKIFDSVSKMARYVNSGGDLELATSVLRFPGTEQLLFPEALMYYLEVGGDKEFADALFGVTDAGGNNWFNIVDLIELKGKGISLETISEFIEDRDEEGSPRYNGFQIYRLTGLGLRYADLHDFHDTEKPNAIFVFPSEDWNSAFQTEVPSKLFEAVRKEYDTWPVIAGHEDEVYGIDFIPDPVLGVHCGHGDSPELNLAKIRPSDGEELLIDTGDKEMIPYLQRYAPGATIFNLSCSTGKGGMGAKNLANFMAENARGRTVIGARGMLPIQNVVVHSVRPFDVNLYDENGNDITYRVSFLPR